MVKWIGKSKMHSAIAISKKYALYYKVREISIDTGYFSVKFIWLHFG